MLTDRAETILDESLTRDDSGTGKVRRYTQLLLVNEDTPKHDAELIALIDELKKIDPNGITPLQALTKITELKDFLKKSGK